MRRWMASEHFVSGSLHAPAGRGLCRVGRRWAPWIRTATRALLLASLLLPAACNDRRISMAELNELEERVAPPALEEPVEPEALGLTDFHPYQVRAGDVLSIRLTGLAEDRYAAIPLDLRVHDDGRVFPPVVDPVKVGGLTLSEVELAIHDAFVPSIIKNLAVFTQLAGPEGTTVLVQGAATAPGLVKLNQNQCGVLYALASAGGFGPSSSGRVRVKPIQPNRPEVAYDLNDVNDVRRALLAPPLESGDIVELEAAEESAIYVAGLVNRPGPILIPTASRLSVLRAVMAAGGLRDYLDVKDATLIRKLADGEQVHVKLDLSDMIAGRTADVAMKPGDILHLPYTVDTFCQEWFLRNIVPGPFSVGLHYDPLAQYNAERALRSQNLNNSVLGGIRSSLGSTISNAFVPPVVTPTASGK